MIKSNRVIVAILCIQDVEVESGGGSVTDTAHKVTNIPNFKSGQPLFPLAKSYTTLQQLKREKCNATLEQVNKPEE